MIANDPQDIVASLRRSRALGIPVLPLTEAGEFLCEVFWLRPLTLRICAELEFAENEFFPPQNPSNGAPRTAPGAASIGQLIWRASPLFKRDEPWRFSRAGRELHRIASILKARQRWGTPEAFNWYSMAIRDYVRRALAGRPHEWSPQYLRDKKASHHWTMEYVRFFGQRYGWTIGQVLDAPLALLHQLLSEENLNSHQHG